MPVYLRKFYLKALLKEKDREAKNIEHAKSKLPKSKTSYPTIKPKFKR